MPEEILGETQSLCPVCLRRLPARRVAEDGVVRLVRTCPEHGEFQADVWRGSPSMDCWRRPKTPSPPHPEGLPDKGCPYDCGLCPDHGQHTCTALVEITGRCDLGCPVCFASSCLEAEPGPSLGVLAERFRHLRAAAGPCNLQLSGGEPTTRADLPDIVRAARAAGFAFVQLNSNGLRLGRQSGYARELAQAGLSSVFLQFDGSDAACKTLRGRPLKADKLLAVEACADAGLGVVLVPTIARGVNDSEVGAILKLALAFGPAVRGVHFQPLAAFGRYPDLPAGPDMHGMPGRAHAGRAGHPRRTGPGPTLPEMMRALQDQTGGMVRADQFHPPGCEHELCSFSGTFARTPDGGLEPVGQTGAGCCEPAPSALDGALKSRAFTSRQWAAPQPGGARGVPADDFDRFLAAAGTEKRFSISCMAFQDAWTIDLERTRGCCIHVLASDGGLVPFCLYNLTSTEGRTLYRGKR